MSVDNVQDVKHEEKLSDRIVGLRNKRLGDRHFQNDRYVAL